MGGIANSVLSSVEAVDLGSYRFLRVMTYLEQSLKSLYIPSAAARNDDRAADI
jgi:hypothetical protein